MIRINFQHKLPQFYAFCLIKTIILSKTTSFENGHKYRVLLHRKQIKLLNCCIHCIKIKHYFTVYTIFIKMNVCLKVISTVLFCLFIQTGLGVNSSIKILLSSERGFYSETFQLFLSCSDPTASIKYTTDCSHPTIKNGIAYTAPIEISTTTIIKVLAFSNGDSSMVETHTFLFPDGLKKQTNNPAGYPATWGGSSTVAADYEMDPTILNHPSYSDQLTDALKSLPVLSLSMPIDEWFNPRTGLYVGYPNSSETREKPVSAEFIYSDNSKNFAIRCGVQNQGGTSIVNWKVPKQSMRLLFKEEYGPKKLNRKLFPDSDIESINTLVVDGFLYSWVHISDKKQWETSLFFRDQLCSDMQNAMGGVSFHGIYVHLFINGLYWGLYDLHERPDEDFMAEYYDAETADFDVIKHNYRTLVAGSKESYLKLLSEARMGFSTTESLDNIKKYLDLPSFIDYMILNFYLGNFDWAHQNYYAAINKVSGIGYRFYTWDAEHVMRFSDVNYDATKKNDNGGPTEIHTLLKTNAEYRMMFADAFYKHAFNNGALTIENFEKSFFYRKNEIDLATILESARWGDHRKALSGVTYTRNDHWIPEVNKVLTSYIPKRRDIVIKQLQRNDNLLYPNTLPPVFNINSEMVKAGETIKISNPNTKAGTIFFTTDGSDPRQKGGAAVGHVYQSAIVVDDASLIKARVLTSGTNEWSPLLEGYFVPENRLKSLMISEIMYNSGYNDLEFIELLNAGDQNLNLIGISFTDGVEYTFRNNATLKPGGYIVLTNNMDLFNALYQFKAYDVYQKNLSNKGETLLLSDYCGNVIDSVSYLDALPWPGQADGKGRSLELINPNLDNSLASNWWASTNLYGSPQEYLPAVSANEAQQYVTKMVVYPNPARSKVNIGLVSFDKLINKELSIEFFNASGQLVKMVEVLCCGPSIEIDVTDMQAGVYQIRLSSGKGKVGAGTGRLVKLD